MKHLILNSNYRARVALLVIRVMGRNVETLTELRDALLQRSMMRSQCHFACWLLSNQHELRIRFNWWLGRNAFALQTHHSEPEAFRQFCLSEYRQSN